MKSILVVGVFLAFCSTAYGITVAESESFPRERDAASSRVIKDDRMLLLGWQGDYLRTTKGTIYADGIKINNFTGLKREKLNRSSQPFEVRLIRNGSAISRIDIVIAE